MHDSCFLDLGAQDKGTRSRAVRALTNLAAEAECAAQMCKSDGMEFLVHLLQRHLPPWESMFQVGTWL